MQFSHFLIKYGEIAVKGKNRKVFEDARRSGYVRVRVDALTSRRGPADSMFTAGAITTTRGLPGPCRRCSGSSESVRCMSLKMREFRL